MMPVFNGERYLRESIASLLEQTYRDFELIIVNDGSTDGTLQVTREFADPRIRLLDRSLNRGVVYSRNEALDAAQGEFLAFFDADDVAHPDKFRIQLQYLRHHPELGLVGSTARRIGPRGEHLGHWKLHGGPDELIANMLFHNAFVNSSVVFRKEALDGLRFVEGLAPCEDYLFWWMMMQHNRASILGPPLLSYRVHGQSLTGSQPERLQHCDREVARNILTGAGMEPTENELDGHLGLKYGRRLKHAGELSALRSWFLKLAREQRSAPRQVMRRVLINRWLKVIYLCRPRLLLMLSAGADLRFWAELLRSYPLHR